MSLSVEESRAKLKEQFTKFPGDQYTQGWADLWAKGDFLPWDRLIPSPALGDTLINGRDLLGGPFIDDNSDSNDTNDTNGGKSTTTTQRRKRALVPGCGRGVDVLLLQSFGYDVVGLEVSPGAVEACEKFATERENEYVVQNEKDGKGERKFVQGDFFKSDWLERIGLRSDTRFELIYDYTRMSELLAPNQFSQLICLEFPTTKPAATGGPPFSSPPKAYMEHLSHPGEQVKYSAEGEVMVNPFEAISTGGLERIAHFHPPVTHQIGKDADGNVMDYISIWRHRY